MPASSSRGHRRVDSDDEDDEEPVRHSRAHASRFRNHIDEGSDQEMANGQANGATSEDASSEEDQEMWHEARDGSEIPNARARLHGGQARDSGFQPGAIIRIRVENFVTYEKAEFLPGPSLNMVIGPNGTGKSSLVCAICLGLGYSPKHLGRATSVKEFVKHGRDSATIEIELQKRPKDRQNFVIKVLIRRDHNGQKWWLNGRDSTQKAIQALMKDLKIQVDNLCQFLAQDRVVEFASSTPTELLRETLRASAPVDMLDAHSRLKELRQSQRQLEEQVGEATETLQNMETRQRGMQPDVDIYREREQIKEQIETLQNLRILADYAGKVTAYNKAKQETKAAQQRFKELEQASGPAMAAVKKKEEYEAQIKAVISPRERAVADAEHVADQLLKGVKEARDKIRDLDNTIVAEREAYDRKKQDVGKSKRTVTDLEARYKNKPADFVAADWNVKIRAAEHNYREIVSEISNLQSEQADIRNKGRAKTAERDRFDSALKNLDSQQGQAISLIRKINDDVIKGWEWLKENRDKFEKEVFGPAALTCSIKDERYSNHVQALLQSSDMLCFTAQTVNDHKILTHRFFDEMGLGVDVRTCLRSYDDFLRPLTGPDLAAHGLDGFAIDFVDGPKPVLAMLCSEKRLNTAGVALQGINESQHDRLLRGEVVNAWVTGTEYCRVNRRRDLGPQAVSTSVRRIETGRFWTNQVDLEEKESLKKRRDEAHQEFVLLKEQNQELKTKLTELESQRDQVEKQIKEIKDQKNELQLQYNVWKALPEKIETVKKNQATKQEELKKARRRVNDLSETRSAALLEEMEAVLRHAKHLLSVKTAHDALLEASIRLIEAQSDVQGLKERCGEMTRTLEEERAKVEQGKTEQARLKEQAKEASNALHELLAVPENQEKRGEWEPMVAGKTAQDIDNEIAAERDKLEVIRVANPNVMQEYERRAGDIGRVRQKLEATNGQLARLNAEIGNIMADWEPRLDALVGRISDAFAYNFEQINCAGEVRVDKDADFEKWSLEILVKFREGEPLQRLNRHHQSGGERAVSTIFYLMALQSMAQSPFRVVDEINQGMDPRNERMVHERMVEIACREHTSQYFLVTPKLLTALHYDPNMTVLCISSGDNMPEKAHKLGFGQWLNTQRRLKGAA